jgi:hypothetical protein
MPDFSGKAGLASRNRSQARTHGRIYARSSASPFARISDTRCATSFDPDADPLGQNRIELVEKTLE